MMFMRVLTVQLQVADLVLHLKRKAGQTVSFTVILYSRMVGLVGRVEPGCAPAIDMKCPGWVDKPFFSSALLHSHDSLQVSA